jgi:surfactin family lipopeptide synthetase A
MQDDSALIINPEKKAENFSVLSSPQERFWFLNNLEPDNSAYNVCRLFTLEGYLNTNLLEQSVNEIIKRHEILRTSFESIDGVPVQEIYPALNYKIDINDLTHLDANEKENELKRLAEKECAKTFQLSNLPLFKVKLYKLSDYDHALLIIMHHIITDGWSLGILYTELNTFYGRLQNNEKLEAAPLEVQYKDFASKQKILLTEESAQRKLNFWKDSLKGSLPIIELPTDKSRPAIPTSNGSRFYFSIPEEILLRLKDLAKQSGCTTYMTVLSAIKVLIYRYTGVHDVIIGSPYANRTDEKLHNLLGVFINMISIRSDLSGNPTFKDVLKRVRKNAFAAYVNQDYPFEQLVKEIHPKRDPLHHPIFQIMLQYSEAQILELPGIKIKQLPIDTGKAQLDFSIYMWEWKHELEGYIEFNTDLYLPQTMERFITHFTQLLQNLIQNSEAQIDEVDFIPDDEKNILLNKWNNTSKNYPKNLTLHNLFEMTAKEFGSKVAIEDEHSSITYSELNTRSSRLAKYLLSLNVSIETLIGISTDRSIEMVVALLGILKAGCAYIPLDPSYPPARIKYMIENSGISLLITQDMLKEKFKDFDGNIINLDEKWTIINEQNEAAPQANVNSENLAYILYTSGSTGKPNGVMIQHSSIINFLFSMKDNPGISGEDVLFSVTSLSFDISVLEIFLPLISGAKLILADKETTLDSNKMLRKIVEKKSTIMQATPATWKLLLESKWETKLGLKILCGGEPLPLSLAKRLLEKEDELWNLYGPTETTIWSSIKKIEENDEDILIGPPIDNTQFFVLDKNMNVVPSGIPGELYIGGDGLARGYFNNTTLTDERFINNPLGFGSNKIYKTGDQVKLLDNGCLEFLGRLDNQIKIRGYRIELGEIESVISSHPSVKDAVAAVKDIDSDKKLIAYVIPNNVEVFSDKIVQKYLSQLLPDYMIPTIFVTLSQFPLTPNGKIDRNNLPLPNINFNGNGHSDKSPSNPVEAELIKIWSDVLGITNIGVKDDFFDLGGHSLLAAELFSKINNKFKKELPISILFSSSTIESMAEIIKKEEIFERSSVIPINEKGNKPPLFLVHGAGGNILLYRDLVKNLGKDQPVYGIESIGVNGNYKLDLSIEEMAAKYIKDMKKVSPEGPYLLGGYCMGGTIALEMARQLELEQSNNVILLALLESYNLNGQKKPFIFRYYNKVQNIIFHIENLLSLNVNEMFRFLKDKAQTEQSRFLLRIKIGIVKISKKFGLNFGRDYPHFHLEELNDRAQLLYHPKEYKGAITLFRPIKHFAGANDPNFGWADFAEKGVNTIKLNVRPRGMLVEPFVKDLAIKLRQEIETSLNDKSHLPKSE